MQLGNFSVGLAVKDIAASGRSTKNSASGRSPATRHRLVDTSELHQHHRALSRAAVHQEHADVQSRVGPTGSPLPDFDDVRDIQRTLKGRGLVPTAAADESSTGPASMVLTDPDGNPILIDQHVPRPRK